MLSMNDGNIYRYTGTDYDPAKHEWTDKTLSDQSNIHWSDLEPVHGEMQADDLCIPSVLSGGDYSNSCAVEYSNYLEWQEIFADTLSIDWWTVSGGYGSYGIAIRNDTDNQEILEMLASLSDYCVINDERMSEVETQWQDETWERDTADDFVRAINSDLDIEIDLDIECNATDSRVFDLFRECMERANEYWEVEQHGTAYIRVEKMVEAIQYSDLIPFLETAPV